jgi:hypothetical protein
MVATKSFALKGGGENDPTATRSLLICGKVINDLVVANRVSFTEIW